MMKLAGSGRRPSVLGAERGFSLIVALMMLIVIIILGISSSQMAINEERGARNDRDRQIAFQAAEAALKDAEAEIFGPVSPACGNMLQNHGRANSPVCFNESSGVYFGLDCSATPAAAQGLCYNPDPNSPAYLSASVRFYADATSSGGMGNTVRYGQFTGSVYPSQATSGMGSLTISRYPPRYIIELVPKNVTIFRSDPLAAAGAGSKKMFRITSMGFGANANTQVVLQSVVSTETSP